MTEHVEHKSVNLEIKQLSDDGTFEGYASVFGVVDLDYDIIEKNAFKRTINAHQSKKTKIKMLWNHDWNEPIGVFLDASEDDVGLFVKGQLILSVQKAREVYDLMKAGALNSMSIGYQVIKYKYDRADEEQYKVPVRRLQEVKLMEISVVVFPANEQAVITNVKQQTDTGFVKLYDSLTPEHKTLVLNEIYGLLVVQQLSQKALPTDDVLRTEVQHDSINSPVDDLQALVSEYMNTLNNIEGLNNEQ